MMVATVVVFAASSIVPAFPAIPPSLNLHKKEVRVCVVESDITAEPDFSNDGCARQRFWELDPQGSLLWVEMVFDGSEEMAATTEPIGLNFSGKASSAFWLNGRPLGTNGVPGDSAEQEVPGRMDAIFFVPPDLLKKGQNRLVVQMSAMNGSFRLSHPINGLTLRPYRSASEPFLLFLPAILAFGLLVASVAYFSVSAWKDYDREGSTVLAVASLAASFQLAGETVRAIASYPYPYHEARLIFILLCASVLSLSLFAYVLLTLFPQRRRLRFAAVAAVMSIMAIVGWWSAGFDWKTLAVLGVGAMASTLAASFSWRADLARAICIGLVSSALVVTMMFVGIRFLDLHLYIALTVLFVWLFVRQAQQVAIEQADRRRAVSRAHELAKALKAARAQSQRPMIEVSQANRVAYVDPADIQYFSGAGDYVEVHWGDGLNGLISETLAALDDRLPPGFIRTHRSYIVNAAHVGALERDASGTGSVVMRDGQTVPVSRRIMPEVRRAMC